MAEVYGNGGGAAGSTKGSYVWVMLLIAAIVIVAIIYAIAR